MDKEKLIKTLKKADNLKKGGEIALANEFISIESKVDSVAQKANKLAEDIDTKLLDIKEELKKKLDEELSYEIDPEKIRGEKGEKGEQGEQGIQGKKGDRGEKGDKGDRGNDGLNGKNGIDGLNGLNGKDGSPDTGEQIVDKINKNNKQINLEKINGISELEQRIKGDISLPITTSFINGKRAKNLNFNNIDVDVIGDTAHVKISDKYVPYTNQTQDIVVDEKKLKSNYLYVNSIKGTNSVNINPNVKFFETTFIDPHACHSFGNYYFAFSLGSPKGIRVDKRTYTQTDIDLSGEISNGFGKITYHNGYIYGIGINGITRIKEDTLEITTMVDTSAFSAYSSITTDGTYIYAIAYGTSNVYKYDIATFTEQAVLTGLNPQGHWISYNADDGMLYASTLSGSVYKIDPSGSMNLLANTDLGSLITDDNAVAFGSVWIAKESGTSSYRLSTTDLSTEATLSLGEASYGAFADATGVYFGSAVSQKIFLVDPSDNSFTALIFDSNYTGGANEICLDYDGLWITNWGYNAIRYFSTRESYSGISPILDWTKGVANMSEVNATELNVSGITTLQKTIFNLPEDTDALIATDDGSDVFGIDADGDIITSYYQHDFKQNIQTENGIKIKSKHTSDESFDWLEYNTNNDAKINAYNDIILNPTAGEIKANSNLNFQKYKAIAMVCDNGATLPSSPAFGQWFLHDTTGRKILMMHNGTSWVPIVSFITATLYVDTTNGTDDQNKGFGTTTDAFKTINFALAQIPETKAPNTTFTVNVAQGTYAESVIIDTNYVTLQGAPFSSASLSATCDSWTKGGTTSSGGPSPDILVDTGAFTGVDYTGYFWTKDDTTFYPIVWNDNNTLWIADNSITSCTTYKIYPPPTTVIDKTGTGATPLTIGVNRREVYIKNIKLTNSSTGTTFSQGTFGSAGIVNCHIQGGNLANGNYVGGYLNFYNSYAYEFNSNRFCFTVTTGKIVSANSVIDVDNASTCIRQNQLGLSSGNPAFFRGRTGNTQGLVVNGGGTTLFGQWFYNLYNGVRVDSAGMVTLENTLYVTFNSCTNNIQKTYTSYYSNVTFGDGIYATNYAQFDATGNFTLIGSAKIPYGSMYGNNISQSVTVSATDTYYEVGGSLSDGGSASDFTFQNSKELKCNTAGKYAVDWSMSVQTATANQEIEGSVMINSTAQTNTTNHAESITANKPTSISGHGIITLAVNDVVKLAVANHTATNNIIVAHANLKLTQVSG